MQKVASVKGQRKTERKGQQMKLRTVNGKKVQILAYAHARN